MTITRLLVVWGCLCTVAIAAEVHLWKQSDPFSGELLFKQRQWYVQMGDKRQRILPTDFAWANFSVEARTPPPHAVILTDGSRITGKIGQFRAGSSIPLERKGQLAEKEIEFAAADVAAIELGPMDPGARVAAIPDQGSVIIMRDGRVVHAEIEWATFMQISVATGGGRLRLPRDQVHRVLLNRISVGDAKEPTGQVRATTSMGDAIIGKPVTMDADQLVLRNDEHDIVIPRSHLILIHSVDPRIHHLSSLPIAQAQETPYFHFIRPHRLDSSLFGGSLVVAGIQVTRGIAMHTRTELTFDLPEHASHLTALLGIDTRVSQIGNAQVQVLVDGKEQWSDHLSAGAAPVPLSIDLPAGSTIRLVADYGADGSIGDHVVWAEPLLIQRQP